MSNLLQKCSKKVFYVAIADADIGNLASLWIHSLYYMLVKFQWTKSDGPNCSKFPASWQKWLTAFLTKRWCHFRRCKYLAQLRAQTCGPHVSSNSRSSSLSSSAPALTCTHKPIPHNIKNCISPVAMASKKYIFFCTKECFFSCLVIVIK